MARKYTTLKIGLPLTEDQRISLENILPEGSKIFTNNTTLRYTLGEELTERQSEKLAREFLKIIDVDFFKY